MNPPGINLMQLMDIKRIFIMVVGLLIGIIFGAVCYPLGVCMRRKCGKKDEKLKDKAPDPNDVEQPDTDRALAHAENINLGFSPQQVQMTIVDNKKEEEEDVNFSSEDHVE